MQLKTSDQEWAFGAVVVRGSVVKVERKQARFQFALQFELDALWQMTKRGCVASTRTEDNGPPKCVVSGRSYPPVNGRD